MAVQAHTTYLADQHKDCWSYFAVPTFFTVSQEVIGSYATLISERITKQNENNSAIFSLEKPA